MATQWFAVSERETGAINSATVNVCQVIVPIAHKLVSATLFTQKTITTGTVTAKFKKRDPNDARGGAQIGTELKNTDLLDVPDITTKLKFVLADDEKQTAPANRIYFLALDGTDAADRVEDPVLLVEVDDDPT